MPIVRQTPLKQNIRVWFDYLKVALTTKTLTINEKKKINLVTHVNKEYYRAWHLPQVRKLSFDKWWKSHKQLFVHKQFINVRVLNELSLNDAMKEVRSQLIGKVDQKSNFHISTKKFRYVEVDDYLKCYKLRNTIVYDKKLKKNRKTYYNEIAIKIARSYRTKSKSKKVVRRTFGVGKAEKQFDRNVLHSVKRRVNNAKIIIMNTAKGQFTGKY